MPAGRGEASALVSRAARARTAVGATERLTIRVATRRDLDVVVELRLALLREYDRHPLYGPLHREAPARARQIFAAQLEASDEIILLAERAARVIGVMRCVDTAGSPLLAAPRHCYLSSVYVRPEERRTGVLRALFAAAQAWCADRGLADVRLHNVPTNAAAAAAWSALGFGVVEHVRVRTL